VRMVAWRGVKFSVAFLFGRDRFGSASLETCDFGVRISS
jgi:hypothetical protein